MTTLGFSPGDLIELSFLEDTWVTARLVLSVERKAELENATDKIECWAVEFWCLGTQTKVRMIFYRKMIGDQLVSSPKFRLFTPPQDNPSGASTPHLPQ